MKKFFTALMVVCALLCFALPAVASPPGTSPILAALGPELGIDLGYGIQEAAPVFGVTSAPASAPYFETVIERETSLVFYIVSIAIAATLAGLMSGAYFIYAQVKNVGRSRAFANGFRGGRRWV
ncbi:MAG: hypothetical protein PHS14_08255 [Elusimicrobia bacterium]|nr:hypothetical protein [Elusimicrobiota bacterium]